MSDKTALVKVGKQELSLGQWRGGVLGNPRNLMLATAWGLDYDLGENFPPQANDTPEAMHRRGMTLLRQAVVHIGASRAASALGNCTVDSVVQSLMDVASLDLCLQSARGEVYLVPFKGICTCMVGYKGFVALIMRHPQVISVEAHLVCREDDFEIAGGTNAYIRHNLDHLASREEKDVIGGYGMIYLRDRETPLWHWMTRDQIDKRRRASKSVQSGKKGPWDFWYGPMACKTIIRAMQPLIPKSADRAFEAQLTNALDLDNKDYDLAAFEVREQRRLTSRASLDEAFKRMENEDAAQGRDVDQGDGVLRAGATGNGGKQERVREQVHGQGADAEREQAPGNVAGARAVHGNAGVRGNASDGSDTADGDLLLRETQEPLPDGEVQPPAQTDGALGTDRA